MGFTFRGEAPCFFGEELLLDFLSVLEPLVSKTTSSRSNIRSSTSNLARLARRGDGSGSKEVSATSSSLNNVTEALYGLAFADSLVDRVEMFLLRADMRY